MRPGVPLLMVLALVGCAHRGSQAPAAPTASAREYYPLAVGNRWSYDHVFLGERRAPEVEIVREDAGVFVDNQGNRLAADAFGVRDEKRYLLREPLEVGRTWTNVVAVNSVEHYRVLATDERCEAPAGRFERCVRVEGRNRIDDKTTLVNEMTFAPRVGLVRVRVLAEASGEQIPQSELLLRRYALATSPDEGAAARESAAGEPHR